MSFMSNAVSNGIATDSDTYWRNLEQGFIDDAWDNTTQVHTILEQEDVGSANYNSVDVWTATTLQISGTNYYKDANQGMQFLFKDISKLHEPGVYYQWTKQDKLGHEYVTWWISYFVHSDVNYQSYSIAVRCDNFLKFIDPEDGNIYSWPCRIGNEATATNEQTTNYIITPHNKLTVVVQRNSQTERLFRANRRFLIGGGGTNDNKRPFRIIALQNAHRNISLNDATVEESANILYLTLELDEVIEGDDFVNGVAYNADTQSYVPQSDIKITPAFKKINKGITKEFTLSYDGADAYSAQPSSGEPLQIEEVSSNTFAITGVTIKENSSFVIRAYQGDQLLKEEVVPVSIKSMIG